MVYSYLRAALCIMFSCSTFYLQAQLVIIDGKFEWQGKSCNNCRLDVLRGDSALYTTAKADAVGKVTAQLKRKGTFLLLFKQDEKVVRTLLVRNRLEIGTQHLPVEVPIAPPADSADLYQIELDQEGNKRYLKNNNPITEITYRFETERLKVDSPQIVIQQPKARKKPSTGKKQ